MLTKGAFFIKNTVKQFSILIYLKKIFYAFCGGKAISSLYSSRQFPKIFITEKYIFVPYKCLYLFIN